MQKQFEKQDSEYPVYELRVILDDDSEDEIYITYIDGDLLECIKALDLPKNAEVDFKELPLDTKNVAWYISPSQFICLED